MTPNSGDEELPHEQLVKEADGILKQKCLKVKTSRLQKSGFYRGRGEEKDGSEEWN